MIQSQLFQRAENGDSLAQAELFQQHYPMTYRLAYHLLRDVADAEEVAMDVLGYVLTHLGQFDPSRGAFTTWLYTMTVNRSRNKRRRKQLAEIPLLGRLMAEGRVNAPAAPSPEQTLSEQENYAALYAAMRVLPEKQREAIILRYFHDLDYLEIGQIVGCSPSTAQSRVWLGQKQLARLMNAAGIMSCEW